MGKILHVCSIDADDTTNWVSKRRKNQASKKYSYTVKWWLAIVRLKQAISKLLPRFPISSDFETDRVVIIVIHNPGPPSTAGPHSSIAAYTVVFVGILRFLTFLSLLYKHIFFIYFFSCFLFFKQVLRMFLPRAIWISSQGWPFQIVRRFLPPPSPTAIKTLFLLEC